MLSLAALGALLVLSVGRASAAPPERGVPGGAPSVARPAAEASAPSMVFATHVETPIQERYVANLVDSLRRFGGRFAQLPIYVAIDDPERTPCERAKALGAHLLRLEADPTARRFPFALKVFAAAQVERLVAGKADTLVWLDAETIVLGPPTALDLGRGADAAVRPVFLLNTVGQTPEQPVDRFWARIYAEAGVDARRLPAVQAELDRTTIRFYVNCEVIAVRPSLGICRRWAELFTKIVGDAEFIRAACGDTLHRIFLHQAVLSAVLANATHADRRRSLPMSHGYPLNLHDRVPADRRLARLADAAVVILEDIWQTRPTWASGIEVEGPLRAWTDQAQRALFAVVDGLYREEKAANCNAYLVTTGRGSVIIDPGGADEPGSFLGLLAERDPVQAILLTHGHEDHRAGIALWRSGRNIPVVGQREMVEYIGYRDRLAEFFRRRDAAHTGAPMRPQPATPVQTPIEATVLFADTHSLEVGGVRFELFHTGGETPDTSLIWVPTLRAVFVGDNYFPSFPMLYTPRGTKPRWALDYVAALDKALSFEPDVVLPGHGDPIVGRERVRRTLTEYRDAVRHVHDAVVAGMNAGKDVYTLMREISLPVGSRVPEVAGPVSWSVRGIYEAYAGWFDGNPVNLYGRPASAVQAELVGLLGSGPVIARGRDRLQGGDPLAALQLADAVLAAAPGDVEAVRLRLDSLGALRARARTRAERNWLDAAIREAGRQRMPH